MTKMKIVHFCPECAHTVPYSLGDNAIDCERCTVFRGRKLRRANYRSPGDIVLGLELIEKVKGEWAVSCLWCKSSVFYVNQTNVGNQQSCGCIRTSTLKPSEWKHEPGLVECTCTECGLTKVYDLKEPGPVVCSTGCVRVEV